MSDLPDRTLDGPAVDADRGFRLYRSMRRIRVFEDHVDELYRSARMPGLAHLYSGQEAVAVGICDVLRRDDFITSTHRGHGHCLAKGAELAPMFAELLGKAAGYCGGKGGSMHIADQEVGNLGANAIVGGSLGIATGAAMSSAMRRSGQVAVCFFGEGALGQGLLYEVMNIAALRALPVVYVCENNLYAEYTHYREVTAGDIGARAAAFGIPAATVDGQDVVAVSEGATEAVDRARTGGGPSFLVCNTYRYHGHHVGDIDRAYYRSREEEREWRASRDPISLLRARMVDGGLAADDELAEIDREIDAAVEAAVQFALDAPYPELDQVATDVYA